MRPFPTHLPLAATLFALAVPLAPATLHSAAGCAEEAMLVFDGSASMAELGFDTTRKTRIAEAREALRDAMPDITPVRRVGTQLAEVAQIAGRDTKAAVSQALDAVALQPDVTGLFPYQLSGGMKQRVLIAMALILRPRLLIADEPTTGLDVLTEHAILTALNTAADETGASVLFISHDLRAVHRIATRTLVMHAGRLVEDADIAALAISKAPAARALATAATALQNPC